MEKNSKVICDSNICVYRTLAVIEPKIYFPVLFITQKYLNEITNTGTSCNLLITDTIKTELLDKNDESFILFKSIQNFCVNKLHLGRYDSKIQKIIRNAEKSLTKFVRKNHINNLPISFNVDYDSQIKEIDRFYLQFPERLDEITKKKINYQSTENERIKKLGQRPNNLPERPDRKILAEAIELKRQFPEVNNCILTNDTDFIEFRNEIKNKFGINIEHIPKS